MCQDVMSILTEKRDLECACLLDFVLYQGSLLDTESWLFRPCGRGPTLAF